MSPTLMSLRKGSVVKSVSFEGIAKLGPEQFRQISTLVGTPEAINCFKTVVRQLFLSRANDILVIPRPKEITPEAAMLYPQFRARRLGDVITQLYDEIDRPHIKKSIETLLLEHHVQRTKNAGTVLMESEVIPRHVVLFAIGAVLGFPATELDADILDMNLVKEYSCLLQYNALFLWEFRGKAVVAMTHPQNMDSRESVKAELGMDLLPVAVSISDFNAAVVASGVEVSNGNKVYHSLEDLNEFSADDADLQITAVQEEDDAEQSLVDEAPVVKAVNRIMNGAVASRVSDIHIEPSAKAVGVRFRVDGLLREVASLPRSMARPLASRIKVMSGLNISETRRPLDGRLRVRAQNRVVDVRVSTVPTVHGEKIVLRVLDKNPDLSTLQDMNLSSTICLGLRTMFLMSQGMLLISGPTGSGKSTTLFAGMMEINRKERNLVTIEDPVEYDLPDATQISVRKDLDLGFADILRTVLRQDPDIIMVGEVRDEETASMCVRAAMTGHLVLSTIHTNSSIEAMARLRDLGVKPFMIASALNGVLAQRLVRRLCSCRVEAEAPQLVHDSFGDLVPKQVFEPAGCSKCADTGFVGRACITELLVLDAKLKSLISIDAPQELLMEAAVKTGYVPMIHDAFQKVREGVTSVSEVLRVLGG